jgi:hypothetical protein
VLKISQKVHGHFPYARKVALAHYRVYEHLRSVLFYHRLSCLLCDNIRMSEETKAQVQAILTSASIPDFTSTEEILGPTVSFHIRRGDKTKIESRPFLGSEYVNKLKEIIPDQGKLSSIKHCFVATDDYHAVLELQNALQVASIHCTLHTLTTEGYHTDRGKEDTLLFLAEMKMLIDASYFIGTFNSNVGGMAALYRGCDRRKQGEVDEKQVFRMFNHYYQSYGVDTDGWYLVNF